MRIVIVCMEVFCGISAILALNPSAQHGVVVCDAYLVCHSVHTVRCCLFYRLVCQFTMNYFKRSILFAGRCLVSESALVRHVAYQAIKYNQMQSPLGKNIVSSCIRYSVAIDDFLSLNHNYIFKNVFSNISDDMYNTVQMLLELISIRSGQFKFSSPSISMFDANMLIDWLSTK